MRHIIIIIVLLFQTRVESSRAVLEVGVGSVEGEEGDCRVKLEVELRRRLVSLWAMWHPHAPAGKRCGEWLIKS